MSTKRLITVVAIVMTLMLATMLTACKTPTFAKDDSSTQTNTSSTQTTSERNLEHATLVHVIDGDTLTVRLDDGTENKVRLIGIDTPESVNPDESKNTVEGDIASDYVKSLLIEGQNLWLEKDVSDTDKYGRWLRYVWMHNPDITDITFDLGTLNAHLVYYGYAHAKDYAPDTKYSETLHSLETAMPSSGSSMPIGPLKKGA